MLNNLNALTDGIMVIVIYLASSWLWLDVISDTPGNMADIDNIDGPASGVLILFACWTVFILALLNAYRPSRISHRSRRYGFLVLGNTIALATAATALYIFRLQEFSRGVLGLYYILSSLALILKRLIARWTLSHFRTQGYNLKHILVIGGGHLADEYIQCVKARPGLGLHVDAQLVPGKTMFAKLEAALHNSGIDEVVLALNIDEIQITTDVIRICEKSGTKISVVPFYNDFIPTNPTVDAIGSVKLIRLRTTPLDVPLNAFCKRAMDLVGSILLLVILSPVFLVIAVSIKLSGPGPVIFRQKRVGLNKKSFVMYKFRSMRVNDEENTAWSSDSDDRRTFLGSLLRKTSLDELPQLWNVLKGDMSLVGPRPEIPFYVDRFRETVPLYMVKYQVRPGMTGWAQVCGLRGDTSIPDRVKHDLWYIEHWSLWLDIVILFKTAFGGMLNQETIAGGAKCTKI